MWISAPQLTAPHACKTPIVKCVGQTVSMRYGRRYLTTASIRQPVEDMISAAASGVCATSRPRFIGSRCETLNSGCIAAISLTSSMPPLALDPMVAVHHMVGIDPRGY